MTKEELNKVLELHKKWLECEKDGVRADLTGANLSFAILRGADLSFAILRGADLSGAILSGADLTGADLSGADLSGAILRDAILRGADLTGADLTGARLDDKEKHRFGVILEKARTGYKKLKNGTICTLSIPKGAIVFCINGSKCRTNKCSVIEGEGISQHDDTTEYKVGKKFDIKNFDLMYNVECSTGIHFFWSKEEAEKY